MAGGQLGEGQNWFLKALSVFEKVGDDHRAAASCSGLGALAGQRGDLLESGRWLVRAVRTLLHTSDPHEAGRNARNFRVTYDRANGGERKELERMWREAGLGDLPAAPK